MKRKVKFYYCDDGNNYCIKFNVIEDDIIPDIEDILLDKKIQKYEIKKIQKKKITINIYDNISESRIIDIVECIETDCLDCNEQPTYEILDLNDFCSKPNRKERKTQRGRPKSFLNIHPL